MHELLLESMSSISSFRARFKASKEEFMSSLYVFRATEEFMSSLHVFRATEQFMSSLYVFRARFKAKKKCLKKIF
jgi:hypothetical protein